MREPGPGKPEFPPSEEIADHAVIAFHRQGARLFSQATRRFGIFNHGGLQGPDLAYLDRARYHAESRVVTVRAIDGDIENLSVLIDTPLPSNSRWPNTYISEFFLASGSPPDLAYNSSVREYDLEGEFMPDDRPLERIRELIFGPESEALSEEEIDRVIVETAQQFTDDKFRRLQEDFPAQMEQFILPLKPEHFAAQTALLGRIQPPDEIGSPTANLVSPYKRLLA